MCVPPPPLTQHFLKPLLSGTSCAVCWGGSLLPGNAAALPCPSACSRSHLNHCPAHFQPIQLITRAGCHSPTSGLGTFVSHCGSFPTSQCGKLSVISCLYGSIDQTAVKNGKSPSRCGFAKGKPHPIWSIWAVPSLQL